MKPSEAFWRGYMLTLYPDAGADDYRHARPVAGVAEIPTGTVVFDPGWDEPAHAGHPLHLLRGEPKVMHHGWWYPNGACLEAIPADDEGADEDRELLEAIHERNRARGHTQETFDRLALEAFGEDA